MTQDGEEEEEMERNFRTRGGNLELIKTFKTRCGNLKIVKKIQNIFRKFKTCK